MVAGGEAEESIGVTHLGGVPRVHNEHGAVGNSPNWEKKPDSSCQLSFQC